MERKLADVLAQADANLEYQAMGVAPPQPTDREIAGEPCLRAESLRGIYY